MKLTSYHILLMGGIFLAGMAIGSGITARSQRFDSLVAPDNFERELSKDPIHPSETWSYFDSVTKRIVSGFIPVMADTSYFVYPLHCIINVSKDDDWRIIGSTFTTFSGEFH